MIGRLEYHKRTDFAVGVARLYSPNSSPLGLLPYLILSIIFGDCRELGGFCSCAGEKVRPENALLGGLPLSLLDTIQENST